MIPTVRLADARAIPAVGFGVFQIPPESTQEAVEQALELGYRHIDTAAAYGNESGVGAAIRASGIPRDELWITTKLRNGDQGFDEALSAAAASRERLGVDRVDLYLIHWPSPARDRYVDSWRALARLQQEDAVASIGVSNFLVEHLDRLDAETGILPAVNQIEVHPAFAQQELSAYCATRGIVVEAYSPLGQASDLALPAVTGIAQRHGVTPAQTILRWHLQAGRVTIPKSVNPARMAENLDLSGFVLTDDDIARIDACETGVRIGGDPRRFEISQIR